MCIEFLCRCPLFRWSYQVWPIAESCGPSRWCSPRRQQTRAGFGSKPQQGLWWPFFPSNYSEKEFSFQESEAPFCLEEQTWFKTHPKMTQKQSRIVQLPPTQIIPYLWHKMRATGMLIYLRGLHDAWWVFSPLRKMFLSPLRASKRWTGVPVSKVSRQNCRWAQQLFRLFEKWRKPGRLRWASQRCLWLAAAFSIEPSNARTSCDLLHAYKLHGALIFL
jgi:hypothetical protein